MSRFSISFAPATLDLAGVSWPRQAETLHLLLVGSTGTGKSTLIDNLMAGLQARGDRVIAIDPNGALLSRFWRAGDAVMNPFDTRSPGWSLFNEVRQEFDYDTLARSAVPAIDGPDASWYGYAQVLLAELLRALLRSGDNTTEALLYWATVAPVEELRKRLAGTAAAGLFDPHAAKALASVRFILTTQLRPHQHLRPGPFSLKTWLQAGEGNLFCTWRSDMLATLRPLLGCWVDVLLAEVLSLPPDPNRRLWLLVDEVAALGKLSSLEAALTMGRKHGLAVVAGLQTTRQLERVYGRDSATVLRACFRNLLVLGIARSDPETAEAMSLSIGEAEHDREQRSYSRGGQGLGSSLSVRRTKERVVLPSELTSLPDLQGYLALSGDAPLRKVTLTPVARIPRGVAIEERQSC